ncbi:CDP-diacylglycerol--glycerol-3-phosphate 3-phosphatidyltransferase [Anaplasma bovis]|uniref:CDP-diacylglycerol--glycerol-3-phosphate 3-phosphatidyltransferase n=1 Tax=Anaplasma bovis TaxID=186733 RepID=UPI002FEF43F9
MGNSLRKILPNLLTVLRVLAIPAVVSSFFASFENAQYVTLCIFLVACITDFLDGFLARMWKVQSRFGRLFDPVADKLIVLSTMVMLVHVGKMSGSAVVFIVIILCREVLVSGMREFLVAAGISLPVSDVGKMKTVVQAIATCFLILRDEIASIIGEALLSVAALLSTYSMYLYIRTAMLKLKNSNLP